MANNLNDARRSLERAKELANKRLLALDIERHEIKSSLKSLDAALKVLDRSPAPKSTGTEGKKSG